MKYRQLGKTGLKVSEIGLGFWAFAEGAWMDSNDLEGVIAVRKAMDMGVNLFNTADAFGDGKSEVLLGKALTGDRKDTAVVVTKIGMFGCKHGYPIKIEHPLHVKLCCEASLFRLRTERIDVCIAHNDDPNLAEIYIEAFNKLQEEGKIWYWGVATNNMETLKKYADGDGCDVVETEYNILNRSAEKELLPFCRKKNIGVIGVSPLAKGVLTGYYTSDPKNDIPTAVKQAEAAKAIESARGLSVFTTTGRTMAQAALAFALAAPGISCVLPGANKLEHLLTNIQVSDMPFTEKEIQMADNLFPVE